MSYDYYGKRKRRAAKFLLGWFALAALAFAVALIFAR